MTTLINVIQKVGSTPTFFLCPPVLFLCLLFIPYGSYSSKSVHRVNISITNKVYKLEKLLIIFLNNRKDLRISTQYL